MATETITIKLTLKPWAKYWVYFFYFLTLGKKMWIPRFLFNLEKV